MYTTIFRPQRKRHHRLDVIRSLPLEPSEFCKRWVNADPEERGYYKACVNALAEATGRSKRTVEGWGADFSKRPDDVLITLRKEDMLNQMRELNPPPEYLKE